MYKILTDKLHRIAYATDASAYREMPLGVAYCESEEDLASLINWAKENHTRYNLSGKALNVTFIRFPKN